jgi:hypothetical protein
MFWAAISGAIAAANGSRPPDIKWIDLVNSTGQNRDL